MRLILTTKKTEIRDKEQANEYRQEEIKRRELDERWRQEDASRADLADEKSMWSAILQTRMEQEWKFADALAKADKALTEYRQRFQ